MISLLENMYVFTACYNEFAVVQTIAKSLED